MNTHIYTLLYMESKSTLSLYILLGLELVIARTMYVYI